MSLKAKQTSLGPSVENSPSSLPVYVVPPRLMRIQDAARYLSATTWQIETLLRENTIPSFVLGKRRGTQERRGESCDQRPSNT